ncbi:hypothetical protein [Neptunomonas japonica]|uniref:hypothetical protein n=1 Tax=Neptunomonas japonica TaxID=417574 RepID=UPI001914DE38|nr:hypothetical protein [Neptunomonas japonica]
MSNNIRALIYDLATGEVLKMAADTPLLLSKEAGISGGWVAADEGDTDENSYMDVTTSPHSKHRKMDYTLETHPVPCTAIIEGVEYSITEPMNFAFVPGPVAVDYEIIINGGIQYLEKEFIVHENAAT